MTVPINKISGLIAGGQTQPSADDNLRKLVESLSPQQISLLQSLDSNVLLTALQQRHQVSEISNTQNASESASDEKRRARRRRVLLAAKIIYNGRIRVIDCQIRDISDTGCRLRVFSTAEIPNHFTLQFTVGRNSRECEMAWRKENDMGIRFLS